MKENDKQAQAAVGAGLAPALPAAQPAPALPLAQAKALQGLVESQEGSIVSRTILGGKAGSVSLFAFAAGQGLSEHTAPFDALIHVYDGEAEVIISAKPITVKAGEMVVMPANEPHALKGHVPFKMVLTMIRA